MKPMFFEFITDDGYVILNSRNIISLSKDRHDPLKTLVTCSDELEYRINYMFEELVGKFAALGIIIGGV